MKYCNLNKPYRVVALMAILVLFIVTLTLAVDTPNNSQETGTFSYTYDTQYTHLKAIEVNAPYEGIPKPLDKKPSFGYVQPWDGYVTNCTLIDKDMCMYFPAQTSNIKPDETYAGIEVGDNQWQKMAGEEALLSVQHNGGPFGAVIVQIDDETGEVIRYWRNHNHVTEWNDPTAHAEVTTIKAACQELGVFELGTIRKEVSKLPQKGNTSHCELYVNAEPCPMCYGAIFWANLSTVVYGATRYDAAVEGVNFGDAALYGELQKPYKDRTRTVRQATSANSLDAFNEWKRVQKIDY
ncbi:nucleoside deaminase [Methanospirillum lacunae]|nr:nucleoside deaminase [Methanospirillum lacunae]